MAANPDKHPKTIAEVNKDGHDLIAGLSRLYAKGSKAFYGGFPALWPAMKTVYNLRRKHEATHQHALSRHPLDELLELWKNRTRHEDGTWSVDWRTLGTTMGIKGRQVTNPAREDDDEEEPPQARGDVKGKGKSKQEGKSREEGKLKQEVKSKEQGNGKNGDKGKVQGKGAEKGKPTEQVHEVDEPKERPRPVPTGRKVQAAAASKTAKPVPAESDDEVEVVDQPPPKKSKAAAAAPPPKPKGKVEVVITRGANDTKSKAKPPAAPVPGPSRRTKATAVGVAKDAQAKYKSKATVGSMTDGDNDGRVPFSKGLAKWNAEQKKKHAEEEDEEEGGGDSEEPEEDGDLYKGEGSGGDKEFEEDDPTAPPLARGKARKAKTIALSQRCFRVFGRCALCTKLNIPCVFSWKRFGKISHNAKVSCDHCHELHKGCENPTPGFLGLDSDLGEYERLAFPPNADGTIPGGDSDDEEGVKTIGDLLTTMLREQRSVGERLKQVKDKVTEVGTGVESSPQHASGLTAAVTGFGEVLKKMENERKVGESRREAEKEKTDGGIAAALQALTTRVAALERQNISSDGQPSIAHTLEQILEKLDRPRRSPSPAAVPSPIKNIGEDSDDDLEPRNPHLSTIPEVSETATSQETTGTADDGDDDGLEPRVAMNDEGDEVDEGEKVEKILSPAGEETEKDSPTGQELEDESPTGMEVDTESPTDKVQTEGDTADMAQGGQESGGDAGDSASRGPSGSNGRTRRTRSMSRSRGTTAVGDHSSRKPKSAGGDLKRKAAASPEREASNSNDGAGKKAKTTKKTKP